VKVVLGAICEWAATEFSLTVYESTGLCGSTNHSSLVKALSKAICVWTASQFSLTVYESTGAVWADESFVTCESTFKGYLCVDSVSVFLDCL
jgi:hypothetical protein